MSATSSSNSRLIIKNIPKHFTEARMKDHFSKGGEFAVTDAKICRKGTKSRQFGFVGFKNDQQAKQALKHFNNTYVDTSKIEASFAKAQGDESIPRPWSRHSEGSSAFKLTHDKPESANKKRELKLS